MYSIRAPSMTQKLQYFEIFSVSFRHFMLYSLCEKRDLRTSHCFSPSPSIWGIIQRENKLFGSSIFKDDLWHGEPKRPGSLILSVRLSKQRFVERALYAHTQKVLWRAPKNYSDSPPVSVPSKHFFTTLASIQMAQWRRWGVRGFSRGKICIIPPLLVFPRLAEE